MISKMKLGKISAVGIGLIFTSAFTLMARQEHAGQTLTKEHAGVQLAKGEHAGKEHAGKEHAGKEHAGKEHAGKKHKKGKKVSAKDIKKTIKWYIKKDSKLKGGNFLIYDDKLNKTWRLDFVKIHDPVRVIDKKTYFACMDFKDADGSDVLDVDFWLETNPHKKHGLKVTDIKIHKLNGNPRFTYDGDNPVEVK